MANAVFVKKQTSLVRDMFLFGCFTGLSYIDIKTLTHDKIQRMDFDGEEWIITRRTKTDREFIILHLDEISCEHCFFVNSV